MPPRELVAALVGLLAAALCLGGWCWWGICMVIEAWQ
jgi:hypothetical protein